MKTGKTFSRIYVILFLIICLMPVFTMPFSTNNTSAEKRSTQKLPKVFYDGKVNCEYFKQLTDYFSDHFGFRQELASANAYILEKLFMTSSEDDVIIGTDGWLYYADTINDYSGMHKMNERQIHNCTKVLMLMEEYVRKAGAEFLFVAAPNKNTLYGKNMPYYCIKGESKSNLDMLYDSLEVNKVSNINLKQILAEENRILYHKLDTHWNNEGAQIAHKHIMQAFGKEAVDYGSIPYKVTEDFTGDLYQMLHPDGRKKDRNILYDYKFHFNFQSERTTTDMPEFSTWNENASNTLLMYRDSFGNALVPFMAEEFGHCVFTKAVPYNMTDIQGTDFNNVVVEIAERHIRQLQEGIPLMEAPERENLAKCVCREGMKADAIIESVEDLEILKLYGYVDPLYTDDDSDIYVRIISDGKTYTYEAFPAVNNAFENVEMNDYGYGLYVPVELFTGGDAYVEVITRKDNIYYTSGNLLSRF